MKKNLSRKLALSRESILTLSASAGAATTAGTQVSICYGCVTEYTWYCPTGRFACSGSCP